MTLDITDSHGAKVVPGAIAQRETWPWWRRVFAKPPRTAKERMAAWDALNSCRIQGIARGAPLLNERPTGIWQSSRIPMRLLLSTHSGKCAIPGWRRTTTGIERSLTVNPSGPLVHSVSLPNFDCDIQDVEGISAGKSRDIYFSSVQSFGKCFAQRVGEAISPDALRAMLAHGEVRILRADGGDGFSLDAWDGRLFLSNHGGAHHFAGAAYIARQLGTAVPLQGTCQFSWLSEPSWRWLLERYRILGAPYAPPPIMTLRQRQVATLLDECGHLINSPQGVLYLLPAAHPATAIVIDTLATQGCVDQAEVVGMLLRKQRVVMEELESRWPSVAAAVRAISPH